MVFPSKTISIYFGEGLPQFHIAQFQPTSNKTRPKDEIRKEGLESLVYNIISLGAEINYNHRVFLFSSDRLYSEIS
jgi:hypothetical protein